MRVRSSTFSSDIRYVSDPSARIPQTFGEGLRIFLTILACVLAVYLLASYLLPRLN